MTADDLTRLRAVIDEATGIPNGCCHAGADVHHRHFLHTYVDGSAMKLPWGRFSATFDPPTVAALIDRVERAERERDEWQRTAEWIGKKFSALTREQIQRNIDDLRRLLTEGADDGQ